MDHGKRGAELYYRSFTEERENWSGSFGRSYSHMSGIGCIRNLREWAEVHLREVDQAPNCFR